MTHDRVTAAAATSERRADVQVLRAIAICAVIWDHAAVPGPFFAAGFRGVDIFYVVSGFVITLSVSRRSRGSSIMPVGDFFARRIQRLYPAFVVVVLMTMGALALTRWIPEMEVRSAEAGLAGTWYCDSACPMTAGATNYFVDNDHLTSSGAERVRPMFAMLFDQIRERHG